MWLTTSSSVKALPSSSVASHSAVNRSSPCPARFAGSSARRKSSSTRRPCNPFHHRPPGHRGPHDGRAGLDRVEEGAVERVGLGTEVVADEDHVGQVQGELLEGRVEPEASLWLPRVEAVAQHRVHALEVADEPVAGERLLHDATVVQVLLEVEQHQAPLEERADEVLPARPVGEGLVPVGEDLGGRLRTEHGHDAGPEGPGPGQRPVPLVPLASEVQHVPEEVQRVAEQRPARVAQDGLQPAAGRGDGERLVHAPHLGDLLACLVRALRVVRRARSTVRRGAASSVRRSGRRGLGTGASGIRRHRCREMISVSSSHRSEDTTT